MIVTDKKYSMDDRYVSKLDLMIKRMSGSGTDDNIIIVDGDEGQGKTEFATGTCYYVANQTGRTYSPENIYFDLDKIIEFATRTKDQIIHFDEGALGMLTTQWWNQNNQKFLQLVMTARKKRHFIIICIPKFYKLNSYLIEERSIALVNVYSRKNLQKGRFCYYTKSAKERLYNDWKRTRIKKYQKYHTFHGSFVQAMNKVFTTEQCEEYERKKDEAILSLTKDTKVQKESKFKIQRDKLLVLLIRELGLSTRKAEKLMEKEGIELKKSQITTLLSPNAHSPPNINIGVS